MPILYTWIISANTVHSCRYVMSLSLSLQGKNNARCKSILYINSKKRLNKNTAILAMRQQFINRLEIQKDH